MASIDELKQKLRTAEADKSKAEGMLQSYTDTLATTFGCSSVEQAEKLQQDTETQIVALESKYNEMLGEVEKELKTYA